MKVTGIKRRMGALLLCMALALGTMTVAAGAVSTNVTAQLSPDILVSIDGSYRTFYNVDGEEVHPINYNGTVYLPLRAIGELMDKNVNWDQTNRTATLSGSRTAADVTGTPDRGADTERITVVLSPDVTVVVDGVRQSFADAQGNTVYPLIYNGSIYLPLRSIGNLMGKSVSWDSGTRTAILGDEAEVTDADSFHEGDTGTSSGGQTTTGLISEETAKSKALSHAGLKSSEVSFARVKLDYDDGRQVYEVEFYTSDYKEYDYEIDARTGDVLSFDYDAEYYQPTQPGGSQSGSYIGETEAKRIALSYVSGAGDSHVRSVKFDYDDGRAEYEVKIIYNAMEYEFEIDASTGAVISRDVESIYD